MCIRDRVTAGYALAQAAMEFNGTSLRRFWSHMERARSFLKSTRPTAVDLFHVIDRVSTVMKRGKSVEEARQLALEEAQRIANESVQACQRIGEYGERLIQSKDSILTHCNAGALATVDWGTALAPMRMAHYGGKDIFVFVDETRPRCQGARLTAWELLQEGIPHAVIVDNAAGFYMSRGEVDLCIVGADRITANGDFANKIGTYEKAVLARENGIPFYVAAPFTTIDPQLKNGESIPIEERSQNEVLEMWGLCDGEIRKIKIAPEACKARNPAFDVTPAKYVTGFITERGVLKPRELQKMFM